MFGLFKRRPGGDGSAPSLDSVRFNTRGYESRGEPRPGQVRVWFTPEGDGLGLYFFAVPPDLPADACSAADLGAFYAAGLRASGGRLVEAAVVRVGGCPAVRVISKTPQQPSGLTYVGSLTLPFRDFSFVVKVQCEERGVTGVREAVLLDRRLATGEVPPVRDGHLALPGWDPDAAGYDAEFPDHPVSRVRRALHRVGESLAVAPGVARLPGFPLPEVPA
jgi:hypothetical protein